MKPDIAGVRSTTLHIIAIATVVAGFGLFNAFFLPEMGAAGDALRGGWPGSALWYLSFGFGVLIMVRYVGMLEQARGLFVQTGLSDGEAAQRQGRLLGMLILLAWGTFPLLLIQQLSEAVGLR